MKGRPFIQALLMTRAVQAALRLTGLVEQQTALATIPAYKPRGKGGKRPARRGNGSCAIKRAAAKAHGIAQNRRNHRG